MNASSSKVQSIIESTFLAAIERLTNENSGSFISDLYVQVDFENGELQLYDDSENLLNKIVIFDWINKKNDPNSLQRVVSTLKAVLTVLTTKGAFENDIFLKPLSISLTDDDFTVLEELHFMDDDLYRVDDPLLKDLDQDLDSFLQQLLSDVE